MNGIVLLTIMALFLFPSSFACAFEVLDISSVLKSRNVIGVIYFKNDNVRLSEIQRAEIDRIATLVVDQYPSDKIVRVEGFTTKSPRRRESLQDSLSRAKSVWLYLEKKDSFTSRNLYLTGFSANQSISKLKGERVEIAIYDNPFIEPIEVYSSN